MTTKKSGTSGRKKSGNTRRTSKQLELPFKTQFNPNYKPDEGETITDQSQTIPNDCLSLKQLLINHSRGLHSTTVERNGVYTGDQIAHRFTDVTEVIDHKNSLAGKQLDLEDQINEELKEAEEKRKAATLIEDQEPTEPPTPPTPENPPETD